MFSQIGAGNLSTRTRETSPAQSHAQSLAQPSPKPSPACPKPNPAQSPAQPKARPRVSRLRGPGNGRQPTDPFSTGMSRTSLLMANDMAPWRLATLKIEEQMALDTNDLILSLCMWSAPLQVAIDTLDLHTKVQTLHISVSLCT